jgi:hypothetical protein
MASHIQIFTHLYENSCWGNNSNSHYKGSSGPGSSLENNIEFIGFFKTFVKNNKINTIVDLGCGDFITGKELYSDLDIIYTGYDAYDKVIATHRANFLKPKFNFVHSDIFSEREQIVSADLCILKDILMHWDLTSIYSFLDYIVSSKKFKYIMIINCSDQEEHNTNIFTGNHRPLSALFFPLIRYNPIVLLKYTANTNKEVSVISCGLN